MKVKHLCCFALLLAVSANAQVHRSSTPLSQAEFASLAARCGPGAPTDTLLAIARTESNLYPNAISINLPRASAKRAGYADGEMTLSRQPRNSIEATRWLRWLSSHHFTVSVGLMQVNAETANRFGVKAEQLLEPCTNVRVGARILITAYSDVAREIGEGFTAFDAALSIYNTGNRTAGFRNSYVADVYANAHQ